MKEHNKIINLFKFKDVEDILENCPVNKTICDNLIRAYSIINNSKYQKIVCTISGGSDSDVMLDICWRMDKDNKIEYVWFDTGLEYQATKEHLKYLEKKYDIKIKIYKALKPIPNTCKQYGQPFLSKYVSEMMRRLQRHNFKWEDKSFEELYKEYPNCKIALMWWTNKNNNLWFDIKRNKWLKEYITENPPTFKISNVCCKYAKKDVIQKLIKEYGYDLTINGVRRAEGGIRATAYKSCFDNVDDKYYNYRPLFWYSDKDKEQYEDYYGVVHSKCYTEYGLLRTGCCGCPFGRDFEKELDVINQYETKLYKAVNNIFSDSYKYQRGYYEFVKFQNNKHNID